MKRLFFIPILFLSLICSATNYHFATAGNDVTGNGSIATPYQSITKLNALWNAGTLAPGDSVNFKRGDTFYGTIVIKESGSAGNPITIGAYGIGVKPIITGFTTLSSWTDEGDGTYSKTVTSEALTSVVTVDGVQVGMGRYPNAGTNLTYTTATSSRITDLDLGASPDWDGAEVVINKNDWTLDRCLISAHSTTTIDFTNLGSTQTPDANRYYFIQNDVRTLTATNEWYHSTGSGELFIYGNPAAKTVKMATLNYLINNAAYDYITVDNINFQGSISHAIYCTSASNSWTVQNCTITNAGQGIYCVGGNNWLINNNTISFCNEAGINSVVNTCSITNNTISDIGLLSGLSYKGTYCDGVYINGSAFIVQYNNIQRTGYNGVHSASATTFTIANNFITYSCQVIDDGGGVYFPSPYASTRTVTGNIILYSGVGGIDNGRTRGIYLDASASNCVVTNNVVANCVSDGMMNGGGVNNTWTGNVSVNNYNGFFLQDYTAYGGTSPTGIVMTGNYFIAKASSQRALRFGATDAKTSVAFANSDNNYFARPVDDDDVFWLNIDYRTLGYWKTLISDDAASVGSPISIADTSDIDLYYNASQTNDSVFTLPYASIDLAGTKYATEYTLDAYQGVVLLKDPDPDVDPPDMPTVTTTAITYNATLTATGGGNCTYDGNGTVSAKGICYATHSSPTTSDTHTHDGTGEGAFTSTLSLVEYALT